MHTPCSKLSRWPLVAVSAVMAGLLGGCGTGTAARPPAANATGTVKASPVVLSAGQLLAVQAGVKKMITSPDSARFSKASGMAVPPDAGVHVCGHVRFKGEGGKFGPDLPYYVELREETGKPEAARGQVGSDDAKRAKVNFMCRRHNGQSG